MLIIVKLAGPAETAGGGNILFHAGRLRFQGNRGQQAGECLIFGFQRGPIGGRLLQIGRVVLFGKPVNFKQIGRARIGRNQETGQKQGQVDTYIFEFGTKS